MEYGAILNHINYFIDDRDEVNMCTRLLNENRQVIHEMILNINKKGGEFNFIHNEARYNYTTIHQLIISNDDDLEYKLTFTYKIDEDTLEYITDEPTLNIYKIELIN